MKVEEDMETPTRFNFENKGSLRSMIFYRSDFSLFYRIKSSSVLSRSRLRCDIFLLRFYSSCLDF